MPVCTCHSESCFLFAWGIFSDMFFVLSRHIVCEWLPVISCLKLCLLPNLAAVAFPFSAPALPCCLSSSLCLPHIFSSLPVFHFLPLFQSSILSEVKSGSWHWWSLWSVYLLLHFIFFLEGIQPQNNSCLSSRKSWQLDLPLVRRVRNVRHVIISGRGVEISGCFNSNDSASVSWELPVATVLWRVIWWSIMKPNDKWLKIQGSILKMFRCNRFSGK